jgi:hypothetical protein
LGLQPLLAEPYFAVLEQKVRKEVPLVLAFPVKPVSYRNKTFAGELRYMYDLPDLPEGGFSQHLLAALVLELCDDLARKRRTHRHSADRRHVQMAVLEFSPAAAGARMVATNLHILRMHQSGRECVIPAFISLCIVTL